MSGETGQSDETFYDRVGGMAFFERLVDRFYDGVETDPVLRPLYPDEDMAGARWRLAYFLGQYWGGPFVYSEQRGHPRLRMRHAPFRITSVERDHWLACMRVAVDAAVADGSLPPELEEQLWGYCTMAADAMRNVPGA